VPPSPSWSKGADAGGFAVVGGGWKGNDGLAASRVGCTADEFRLCGNPAVKFSLELIGAYLTCQVNPQKPG